MTTQKSCYLYIVKLENGTYYVGNTEKIENIIVKKITSKWIEYNNSIIVDIKYKKIEKENNAEKTATTLKLMKIYGIDKVRGGGYSQVIFNSSNIREINNFLKYLDPYDSDEKYIEIYNKINQINRKIGRIFILNRFDYHELLKMRDKFINNNDFDKYSPDEILTRNKRKKMFNDIEFLPPRDQLK
jgi:predicted GIY-YIG superfamily endonuclease